MVGKPGIGQWAGSFMVWAFSRGFIEPPTVLAFEGQTIRVSPPSEYTPWEVDVKGGAFGPGARLSFTVYLKVRSDARLGYVQVFQEGTAFSGMAANPELDQRQVFYIEIVP